MNLTYGVIAVVGICIAISLALIVADPNETPQSRELAIPENNIAQIEEELNQISVNPSLLTSTSNVGEALVFEVEFMDDDGNIVDHVNYDTFKEKSKFFSYRKSQKLGENDYGRCISVISLTNFSQN